MGHAAKVGLAGLEDVLARDDALDQHEAVPVVPGSQLFEWLVWVRRPLLGHLAGEEDAIVGVQVFAVQAGLRAGRWWW